MTDINTFAEPTVTYLVQVRPPKNGEQYLNGAKVDTASRDYNHVSMPVIVGTVTDTPA